MTRLFEGKLIKSSKLSLQRPSITNREHSSAGSEHLPYKQRVRGSNPFAPTKIKDGNRSSFSFIFRCAVYCALPREHSSAGSEHLPYKQRVRGSNPFAPTENEDDSKSSFLFCAFSRCRAEDEMQSRGLKSSFCFLCLWSCASTRHCRNKQKPAALLFISAFRSILPRA